MAPSFLSEEEIALSSHHVIFQHQQLHFSVPQLQPKGGHTYALRQLHFFLVKISETFASGPGSCLDQPGQEVHFYSEDARPVPGVKRLQMLGSRSCAFLPASPQVTWVTYALSHVSWCEVSCARPELPARLRSGLVLKPCPEQYL